MLDEHPRPGDTIEVTWDFDDWKGRRYVVVECPESHKGTEYGDDPSNAWVIVEEDREASYLLSCNYKIVARGNGQTTTGEGTDKSLDRQRDDNLRGVFT